MAKSSKKSTSESTEKSKETPSTDAPRGEGIRETVESIIVAFVFAFLFRTFEAEAFVIPTGSMAPTLLGRHKDVECEMCRYRFRVGASSEMNRETQQFENFQRMETANCPNCRYKNDIETLMAYTGDRILVNKFPYEVSEPKRWDVPVFKYPEHPETNYIKRLVGLPGETIQIRQGNIYAKKGGSPFQIQRKTNPNKQRPIQILVHHNDYPPMTLYEKEWPQCWAAVTQDNAAGNIAGWSEEKIGWKQQNGNRSFQLKAKQTADGNLRWLRYRHLLPTIREWDSMFRDQSVTPRPRLITDYCAYNVYGPMSHSTDEGLYWNGELTIHCEVEISDVKPGALLLLELNQGARKYRCRFNLETGEAALSHTTGLTPQGDEEDEKTLATQQTALKGAGTHHIIFANVDNRLCLWVDDHLVDYGAQAEYLAFGGRDVVLPEKADLIPVGIAAKGCDITANHLLLQRDIYYRADFRHPASEFDDDRIAPSTIQEYTSSPIGLLSILDDPEAWGREYESHLIWKEEEASIPRSAYELKLDDDEYLMLGDNSPYSSDSRLWANTRQAKHRHAVPRDALVGKAFYVYWPHGIPFMNDGKGYTVMYHKTSKGEEVQPAYPKYSFPFYPNVFRMRRIR